MTHENAISFLERNNLEKQFRGLMADGKNLTLHSDRWSLVFDWIYALRQSTNIDRPEGIETDLTYYWESLI